MYINQHSKKCKFTRVSQKAGMGLMNGMMHLIKLEWIGIVCHTDRYRCNIAPLEGNSCNIDMENNLSGRDKTGLAMVSRYVCVCVYANLFVCISKRLVRKELGGKVFGIFRMPDL